MSCNSRFSIEKQGKVTAVNHIGSYWCCVIFNRGTLPCTALLEVSRAFFLPAVVIGVISSPGSLGWARSDQEMETETGTAEQHLSSAGKKTPNTNQTRKKKLKKEKTQQLTLSNKHKQIKCWPVSQFSFPGCAEKVWKNSTAEWASHSWDKLK